MRIFSTAEAQAVDRATMDEYGIAGVTLMERAGRAVAEKAISRAEGGTVGIVCGKGNNGGDGFACASQLHEKEISSQLISTVSNDTITGDAEHFLNVCIEKGIEVTVIDDAGEVNLGQFDLIVDALLGTGITGQVRPNAAHWIDAMNSAEAPVLSIDIPSGVNGTSGAICGTAVRASSTVTMGFLKQGIVMEPGRLLAGEITVADLGYPSKAFDKLGSSKELFDEARASDFLTPPPPETYKHRQGKLLIIAGSRGFTGAACLAANAAMRSGAGLVVAAVPGSLNSIFESKLTEPMTLAIPDEERGFLDSTALEILESWFDWSDAVLIGPGLGTDEAVGELVKGVIKNCNRPFVIDADALGPVSRDLSLLSKLDSSFILTPHIGEASRLFDIPREEISADPFQFVSESASRIGGVFVLKGAPTLIAYGDRVTANTTGHQGLASGGTGDVLAGIMSSFLCQGMAAEMAAQLSVFVHGRTADVLLEPRGYRGLIASDIIDKVPSVLAGLELRS